MGQRQTEDHNDIYLIEAVGPLAVLETFPKIVRNCLWVHYIDNIAAQYSLIKGSSTITCGDVVVGETWKRIQRLGVHAYFDRVESKANPVDGLSRGKAEGPWRQVLKARLPENLQALLAEEVTNDLPENFETLLAEEVADDPYMLNMVDVGSMEKRARI